MTDVSQMSDAEIIRAWRADPILYVRQSFNAEPDAWQADALRALGDPSIKRIALQACAGPGKSCLLAWSAWWFLHTQGGIGEHPKGAALSVTESNLRDNLWAEIGTWYNASKACQRDFVWSTNRIYAKSHPNTWFISARSFAKSADAEEQGRTLSGLHARNVLYLIDESGDISPAVLRAAEQGMTNCEWGKILQSGNPTSLEGMLYVAATSQRHLWHIIRITGDPEDPKRSPRISVEWAKEQIALHGRDNPWVKSYILGQFPPSSINTLLGAEEVEQAMNRTMREADIYGAQMRLGVDVARFGDDATVIFPRKGLQAFTPIEMRDARSDEVAARVAMEKDARKSEAEFIDGTGGYGSGVVDAMLLGGHAPMSVNFAGRATDQRYFNKRSEMWFEMRDWIRRGGCLPKMPQLARELTTPTYTFHGGKFRLEEKEQIKKRLGHSCDAADALALTFAVPDRPTENAMQMGLRHLIPSVRTVEHEFDPYRDESVTQGQYRD